MEEKKCRTLCKGLWFGGAIAIGIVLSRKEWRTKVVNECKKIQEGTMDTVEFLRENREEIKHSVKQATTELSEAIKGISTDIKTLSETASHLKESSEEIMKVTKEAAGEMKNLKK